LARKLVKEYGMSKLGPIVFGEREESMFLDQAFGEFKNYSEEIARQIDKEVAKFISDAQNSAQKILTKKRNLLEKIAKTLIEKETIEREEFEGLLKGKAEPKINLPTKTEKKMNHLTKNKESMKVKVRNF
jgi:cell division protease FtsH